MLAWLDRVLQIVDGEEMGKAANHSTRIVRLAAVADVHYRRTGNDAQKALLAQVPALADVLAICGDLTDHGLPEEAALLAKDLSALNLPIVAVLGNHDFHSDQQAAVTRILEDVGVQVLDGEGCDILGLGFAGVKGFAGGFGTRLLEPWGERIVKGFVQEAVDEAMKLESALARVRSAHKIAVLHYAPIEATVVGEPCEILPFLGSSRLEEPLNRYGVHLALHGHAHHGSPEGKTSTGIPVYNVSVNLLKATFPDRPAVRIFEVPVDAAPAPDLSPPTSKAT
jgi:Icc-related predicted phosphoesterase